MTPVWSDPELADDGNSQGHLLSSVDEKGLRKVANDNFAATPPAPYFAVVFSSQRNAGERGYSQMADRMVELASSQPGFLGVESARGEDGFGITVSYWTDEAAIRAWKQNAEHRIAQEKGSKEWYEHYELRVARVERAYEKRPGSDR